MILLVRTLIPQRTNTQVQYSAVKLNVMVAKSCDGSLASTGLQLGKHIITQHNNASRHNSSEYISLLFTMHA